MKSINCEICGKKIGERPDNFGLIGHFTCKGKCEKELEKKYIKKFAFIFMLPIVMIFAFMDTYFIGATSYINYVFICFFEYMIFWFGWFSCEQYLKEKEVKL